MAGRLRALRTQNRLSLEALAAQVGVTKSYLSKVERGLSEPSISTALKIAEALGVEVGRLFSEEVEPELVTVVRAGERTPLGGPEGSRYEGIAAALPGKRMVPFVMYPPLDGPVEAFKSHRGEEFLFVHQGRAELEFPDRTVRLGPGDSVYFNAAVPHRCRSTDGEPAQILVVIHDEPDAGDDRVPPLP
ncbi:MULTISPECIES: XRE family transcriptional regulator [Kitasatospora]|uniref:Putative transcriptional regulator n=1 Tax=Kitasatospora setae (strain ATCC 33774 / DSM 43861 / JCM 3304 / KCC A-0304 / NBRC 14216 / KM-6054) TaxID=452652 RepID=E4N0W1_KITSK|nr:MULTISPECIES: XRE family transcriptional regulator [Kitasatospora]BAJ31795.1 putative transcriptional regulator [Kitasatospora setae KM-6054]